MAPVIVKWGAWCVSLLWVLSVPHIPLIIAVLFSFYQSREVWWCYPKVKHKLLFVLSVRADTMTQCSDNRLQLLLAQKKLSEHLIAKENLIYHVWIIEQLCLLQWRNKTHAINTSIKYWHYVVIQENIYMCVCQSSRKLNNPFCLQLIMLLCSFVYHSYDAETLQRI